MFKINVPLTVPKTMFGEYKKNIKLVTKNTGRLMLFAGDQKIEHLNNDFVGKGIAKADGNPEHFFQIAHKSKAGAFASQLGLIARYGNDYRDVNYIVKLNSKTNLIPKNQKDPFSSILTSVEDVIRFKKQSKLKIVGVGYTIYIGSEYESDCLRQAAQAILKAHQHGLITIIWIYTRGKAIKNEADVKTLAGAAGVVASLGGDFAKIVYPDAKNIEKDYQQVIEAAGRTKVICVGGARANAKEFLELVHEQIHLANTGGCAVGRNIHQLPIDKAVNMANALVSIVNYDHSAKQAYSIYLGKKKLDK